MPPMSLAAMMPLQGPLYQVVSVLTNHPSLVCEALLCIFSSPLDRMNTLENLTKESFACTYWGKSILGTQVSQGRMISLQKAQHAPYLPKHPQGHLEQTAPTISCTWVWRSIPVFQICTNVLQDTSLPLL